MMRDAMRNFLDAVISLILGCMLAAVFIGPALVLAWVAYHFIAKFW